MEQKILRVEIEYDNETVSLTGEDAIKWREHLGRIKAVGLCWGITTPLFNWKITKKGESK